MRVGLDADTGEQFEELDLPEGTAVLSEPGQLLLIDSGQLRVEWDQQRSLEDVSLRLTLNPEAARRVLRRMGAPSETAETTTIEVYLDPDKLSAAETSQLEEAEDLEAMVDVHRDDFMVVLTLDCYSLVKATRRPGI